MKNFKQFILAVGVLLSRFANLPANFSPLGSFGFFGGNALFFFGAIIAHDYIRGGFYPGFWLTYVGFLGYIILGKVAKNSVNKQLVLLPTASLLFFFFSNLGVWWYWYPHTLSGLTTCFMMALPFYRNTFLGDVLFGYGYMLGKYLLKNVSFSPKISPIATTT